MDYQQTLDYLYYKLPMFSHVGSAAFKSSLTNIKTLCAHLNHPQQQFKSIHIGGTNGKGSVSHMLASVLQTAGYKTGLYTSPHLYDFRERIRINGEVVPEQFVVAFVENLKPIIESIHPSFFEITVAMAFQYFAAQHVDVAVIEVGLGGRLDSTNIINPELSVITNISWDHMNLLGTTLEQIAFEKAGIIKQQTPVVIGEADAYSAPIFKAIATEKGAPLYVASEAFTVTDFQMNTEALEIEVLDKRYGGLKKFILDLPGIYQTKNLITVLQAVSILQQKGFSIEEAAVKDALRNTKKRTGLHGRWEVVHHAPTVVLEVAHNKAGMLQMLEHIANLDISQLHLVMGMVKDKEIEALLQMLPRHAMYYFTQAHIPRALDAAVLLEKAKTYELNGIVYDDVNDAIQAALNKAAQNDLIVVCGSIFLVAEVDSNALIRHQA